MAKRKLPTVMWAGFTDGKMDIGAVCSAMWGDYGYLYPTRRAAQNMYSDVRRVKIMEVRTPRRKRGKA